MRLSPAVARLVQDACVEVTPEAVDIYGIGEPFRARFLRAALKARMPDADLLPEAVNAVRCLIRYELQEYRELTGYFPPRVVYSDEPEVPLALIKQIDAAKFRVADGPWLVFGIEGGPFNPDYAEDVLRDRFDLTKAQTTIACKFLRTAIRRQ